jgi:hypothetical protein
MHPLDAEFAKHCGAASGMRSQAPRLVRRGNTAVARADGPDHPEAVQRRLGEQGHEPGAEDAGMDQGDHFTGAALVVVRIAHVSQAPFGD